MALSLRVKSTDVVAVAFGVDHFEFAYRNVDGCVLAAQRQA